MHLYNAWLPPPVAEETKREKGSFARVVKSLKECWRPDDPESVYATLKWLSVADAFLRAKSELAFEDVEALVELGLEVFRKSDNKLFAQVRWGNVIARFLNKYSKKLSVKVQWRPLYDTLIHTHFTRNTGPEGWRLRQRHFETITSLVRSCRQSFPQGSALEIWTEFKSLLENPWHNSSFEGSGFLRLFLPTNIENQDFFTQDIVEQFISHWDMTPNCQFWNSQWTDIIARVIKKSHSINWENYMPGLFTRYLNMFEVPVANGSGSYPFPVDVPRNTRFLFSNRSVTPAKAIAKSIVFLLKPGSSGQKHFEKLVDLLEQYYHPSNGGRWTYSLERFLFYLVLIFQKRLLSEKRAMAKNDRAEYFLGRSEMTSFVVVMLRLIDRGQYSKNEHLSETVAAATSILSYLEPSLVFPFVASRFHMALETMTATHQLKTAVTSVAYTGRSLFLSALSDSSMKSDELGAPDANIDLLMMSLSNALLGMDANDPPKTLATMQLIGSLFSNMAILEDNLDSMPTIQFSEWLDEFFCRLFSLLLHLEPNSVLNEGQHSAATSGTFLVEDGPYYFCMLEVLLGRLSKPLYNQALKKICKFVRSNILPGAVAEVGLLCCACVHSNQEEAVVHLVGPLISSVMSSLKGTPTTSFGGSESSEPSVSYKTRPMLSPALETAIDYQLKILSVAISYGGAALLPYMDQFKETINAAFNSTSWKVNGAGDHLLRSLLGSFTLYYPINQYRCLAPHSAATSLEEWISSKDFSADDPMMAPEWHIPSEGEIESANELLNLHFQSALDDLSNACHAKHHSDTGMEKEHLKVILLRIDSALQGVLSCLPDFKPSVRNKMEENTQNIDFLMAGASGTTVGSIGMREKAAEIMHAACKYLLEEKSDDSILLILLIRIVDALTNYGSLEYDEWLNHRQAWKLESAAIIEPPINLIVSSQSKGKKRPRWALIDKAYMHSTWRASQSSYHLFRMTNNYSPSDQLLLLMDDLLKLSLHRYETVRLFAGKSLLKMIKRWPTMISKCVITLTENLRDPNAPEYAVLGSCAVLSTQTVLKYLTTDATAFSSFLLGILSSSHHETLKCQKAINELFVKYNIHFAGVSRSIFRKLDSDSDGPNFSELVSQIGRLSYDSSGLHWRYNLMANRVLLLLAMASRSDPNYLTIRRETAGHFLTNLKSQLPQTRILAISALNTLLKESPYKLSAGVQPVASDDMQEATKSSLEGALSQIFQQEGFFEETFNSLSHVHVTTDAEGASSRSNGNSSIQSVADKSITRFYFDFVASWPRTPSWISLLGSDTFYSSFARIFKRLIQECGMPVLSALRKSLEEFMNAGERSKQCVAAEALAGVLHSDVNGLLEEWDSWMMDLVKNVLLVPSVESTPEWAACIRYAVTGKGKQGAKVPILRPHILNCLMAPLPTTVTTSVIAKRYAFLSAALIEISPQRMPPTERELHRKLLEELLENMSHSSAQVRETVGVALSVLCSNIRLFVSFAKCSSNIKEITTEGNLIEEENWAHLLTERAYELVKSIQKANQSDNLDLQTSEDALSNGHSEDDSKWMETLFHFMISSMKSGRSSYLIDTLVALLYPVIALQETSNKDLSTLAKAAFELFKWRVLWGPDLQKAVSVVLSSAKESNWRTRSATLTYLRTFMYRHTFTLSNSEKQQIWKSVESLLTDSQVEVREHAAAVLAGLMKGGDEELARDFRVRAYAEASHILQKRKQRKFQIASMHGAVLALAASVLSVPYDMPSWLPDQVTLLARFVGEASPVKSTVTKAVAEFRRTHADTWNVHKDSFTEEQLEVLADTSSSSSYFA